VRRTESKIVERRSLRAAERERLFSTTPMICLGSAEGSMPDIAANVSRPPDALLRRVSAVRDNLPPFPLYAAAQTGRATGPAGEVPDSSTNGSE
jgi:hypothetical protein